MPADVPKAGNRYVILFIVFLVAAAFAYGSWWQGHDHIQTDNTPAALSDIPTPRGWYLWGGEHLPDFTSGAINNMTFGDQPVNGTGNNTTTLIIVNVEDNSGRTDEASIDALYSSLEELGSPTTTKLWEVINHRLALEAAVRTPSGGYDLDYYLFDGALEYSFALNPWYSDSNITASPDARTLQTMVQSLAATLPSSTLP
jgi:hypothetical protein